MLKLIIISLLVILPATASAEDLELINRPVNVHGLTGLLFTTSPFTVPAGDIELTALISEEKSDKPDYTIYELPSVSLTVGISPAMELALKGSYIHDTGADGIKIRGAGNTELSYKWNFVQQAESSLMPALAMTITGIAAGDDEINIGNVSHWGARAGLCTGKEIDWGDHVIGIFADGSIVVHDLNKENRRDRYGVYNAGLIIPISKYRNLQMMLEYTVVSGIDRPKTEFEDYSAVSTGIRLVTERINFSIGTQFLNKQTPGHETANKILGMAGIKF